MAQPNDDLTLTVAGQRLSGWTDVRVRAGVDRCPRDFQIGMSERYPGEFDTVSVKAGDPCEVLIGSDRVVTGYVDRIQPAIAPNQHSITVIGRGQCADLVDCSARWPSNQVKHATLLGLAQKLADPYGIAVERVGDPGSPVPQFNIIWGETAYAVIDRVASYEGLLAYETPGGNLMISPVGSTTHASGFAEGVNVERAVFNYSIDQRYSTYKIRLLAFVDPDITGGGTDIIETAVDEEMAGLKLRNGQPRDRFLYIVCESGQNSDLLTAKRRGQWEAAVRVGRSFNVALTSDNWRDSAGALWTPNQFARLNLPGLKVPDVSWVIADVIFRRDASGTHADLVLMPKEAFVPEPFLLTPILRGVVTPAIAPNNPPSEQ